MPTDNLILGVLSDIHAYDPSSVGGESAPSYARIHSASPDDNLDPFEELGRLIREQKLCADMLLCPGDLGDKAEPKAIKYAWEQIQMVGKSLNCSEIIATAGNHDVDSTHKYTDHDAKGYLQSLAPEFPFPTGSLAAKCDEYWSQHFALLELDSVRIVVLNSAAYHGESADEIKHGRISQRTLGRIKAKIGTCRKLVNVLLCHHHPLVHAELNLGERDTMRLGSQLLDMLSQSDCGSWIVIHGHKHHPRITYAQGSAKSAVVFAAGSFSAQLYPALGTSARNQFYIVSLPLTDLQKGGIHGRFLAWDWIANRGWQAATKDSGLPSSGGFGCRSHPSVVASEVGALLKGAQRTLTWDEVRASVTSVEHLLPADFQNVVAELRAFHSVEVLFNSAGMPVQIGAK